MNPKPKIIFRDEPEPDPKFLQTRKKVFRVFWISGLVGFISAMINIARATSAQMSGKLPMYSWITKLLILTAIVTGIWTLLLYVFQDNAKK